MAFNLDLSQLQNQTQKAAKGASLVSQSITGASVTLTRDNHDTITAQLTVSNNIATGRVDNLDIGYWHVTVHVFDGQTEIYTGQSDANVLSGVDVQVKVQFDPAPVVPPTTGALTFTVGMNPLPGFKVLNQQVTKIVYNDVDSKTYILDSSAGIIAVYNAETMVRERDITLPQVPLAFSLSAQKDAFYLGYQSGKIYRLDIKTGQTTLVGDVMAEVTSMEPVNDTFLLVITKAGYYLDSYVKVLNVTNAQVVANQSYYESLIDLVRNPYNGVFYALDQGVSPEDIFRIQIDASTGAITALADSRYHGDYYFGSPLRIINKGTRVVGASGKTFFSSTAAAQDITYGGYLGYSYADAASDDPLEKLYLLSTTDQKKLLVLRQDNFFVEKTVDLLGTPKRIYQTPTNIVVFTLNGSTEYYVKVFAKADLGLM